MPTAAKSRSLQRGDTVHNRVINKIGTVAETLGDTVIVLTPSGTLHWSVTDVDFIPDD